MRADLPLSMVLLALGAAACTDLQVSAGDEVEVEVSELIPTVVTLRWSTELPTTGFVEYGLDGAWDGTTPTDTPPAREHEVTVLGLKAMETYEFRAVSVSADGEREVSESVEVSLDPPPAALTSFTISEADPDRYEPGGFILTSVITPNGTWTVIIDRDGDYVWWWDVDEGVSAPSARFGADDKSVTFLQVDDMGTSDVAGVERVALDGSSTTFTRTVLGHHDALVLPDGTVSWLSFDFRDVELDGEPLLAVSDTILETPEGSDASVMPTLRFAMLDQEDPYVHCEHFWEELFETGAKDFSHGNSLTYDETTDSYRVMMRNLDALLIVDRATGTILKQIGGDHADIATADPDDMWSHAHMSQAWEGGFMVFDNGDHRDPQASRVSEYALDLEAGTLELAWTWSDPEGIFNPFFGDAQKLTETWLTAWTSSGRIQELSADGEVVWRAETEAGSAIGRIVWVEDLYTPNQSWQF